MARGRPREALGPGVLVKSGIPRDDLPFHAMHFWPGLVHQRVERIDDIVFSLQEPENLLGTTRDLHEIDVVGSIGSDTVGRNWCFQDCHCDDNRSSSDVIRLLVVRSGSFGGFWSPLYPPAASY